jgi:hypothetical protein
MVNGIEQRAWSTIEKMKTGTRKGEHTSKMLFSVLYALCPVLYALCIEGDDYEN